MENFTRLNADTRISNIIFKTQSIITSEDQTTGRGPDFRLEESNARAQNLLPPGPVENQIWIRTYRHMDVLGKIKKKWNSENKFNENTIYNRKRYYTSYAVNGFSLSKKISKSNMMSSEILVNIKGEELHPHMEKFSLIARKTRIQNLQNVTKSESWFVLSRSTIIQTLKNPPEKKQSQSQRIKAKTKTKA